VITLISPSGVEISLDCYIKELNSVSAPPAYTDGKQSLADRLRARMKECEKEGERKWMETVRFIAEKVEEVLPRVTAKSTSYNLKFDKECLLKEYFTDNHPAGPFIMNELAKPPYGLAVSRCISHVSYCRNSARVLALDPCHKDCTPVGIIIQW